MVSTANRLLHSRFVAIHQSRFLFFQTPQNQRRGRNFHPRRGRRGEENLHNYSSLAAPHQTSVIVMATTPPGPNLLVLPPLLPSTISHPLPQCREEDSVFLLLLILTWAETHHSGGGGGVLGGLNKADQNTGAGKHGAFSSISQLV